MVEKTEVCSGAVSVRLTNDTPNRLLPQRRRRRWQQPRARRFVNEDHTITNLSTVLRLFFFARILLARRVSLAFALCYFRPSRWDSTSTTKITTALSASGHLHPVEHEHGLPSDSDDVHEAYNNSSTSCDKVVVTITRRASLASGAGLAAAFFPKYPATAAAARAYAPPQINVPSTVNDAAHRPTIPSLTIPLQYQPTLSAYTISYRVGESAFGAIIDTGSPFLLVPRSSEATCRPEYRWGCFRPEESRPAPGLKPTVERFDGNEGSVEWREAEFSFDAPTNGGKTGDARGGDAGARSPKDVPPPSDEAVQSLLFPKPLMTFGVISESLMDGPGGIFLGLVKKTNGRIRPSFLGQSDVSAFSIDLREGEGLSKSLTLYAGATSTGKGDAAPEMDHAGTSSGGTLTAQNAIPLVPDLNKKYGDPTIHYVGVASSVSANGHRLASTSRRAGKVYCIFDTGCSGMSIDPGLLEERYDAARARKEKNLWGTVEVEFETAAGKTVTLSAKRPITTPLGSERPWGKKLDGHLIVLGLSFLDGVRTTVDADGGRIWFED